MTTDSKFPPEGDTTKLGRILEASGVQQREREAVSVLKRLDWQHAGLALVFLATVLVPDLLKGETALGLSAWVGPTGKVLGALTFLVGLLKQFAPPGTPFGMRRKVAAMTSGALLLLGVSCTPAQVAVADATLCVLDGYAHDAACRPPPRGDPVACAEDLAKVCGTDLQKVQHVLSSERATRAADGVAP